MGRSGESLYALLYGLVQLIRVFGIYKVSLINFIKIWGIQMDIEKIIEEMTLEEKIGMCYGAEVFKTGGVPRLGIPGLVTSDGPMGIRMEVYGSKEYINYFEDGTMSFTPIGLSDDYTTYLPCNMALAATWNKDLAYESGSVLGEEARGRGKDVVLAPGINIVRTPLCGRNFEYMSEDPYLIGEIAVPFVQGVERHDVAACVKHFVANNQETERLSVSVEMDEKALREIYLPGFEKVVKKGKVKTIMSAYNRFRGDFCSENSYLLKDILRDEWGFDGVVISDWGAVHHTLEAAHNGLDIEMNVTNTDYYMSQPLVDAIKQGKVKEEVVNEKVRNILKLMQRLNMFSEDRKPGECNKISNREKTLKVAEEAIVLLKNEKALLPLNIKTVGKVAVIGDNGDRVHSNGGGSSETKALYEITPLMGIKQNLGGNVKLSFARGYSEDKSKQKELFDEAINLAKVSDTVIFVGGLNHKIDVEESDKKDMNLPYGQDALIKALLEINPRTVIVMLTGSPVDMTNWVDEAHTLVQTWYTGMEGGYALGEVLVGKINPSGKLPITFPYHLEDCGVNKFGEYPGGESVTYNDGVYVGYRYYNAYKVPVLFEFGYGLSYTQFEYSNLQVEKQGENLSVQFILKNIGEMQGKETAQLYIEKVGAEGEKTFRQLKGFEKVDLVPGEEKEVTLILQPNDFMAYNIQKKAWEIESSWFKIAIGTSVENIKLEEVVNL